MFKSIQTKTMFYLVILAIGVLIIVGFAMTSFVGNMSQNQKEEALKERALLFSSMLNREASPERTPEEYYALLKETPNLPKVAIDNTFLINKDMETIGNNQREKPYKLDFQTRSDYQYTYKNGKYYVSELRSLDGIPNLDGWYLCTEENFETAFVSLNYIKTGIIVLITILLFILWPLSRRLTKSITNPIRGLAKNLRKAANGDISHEINYSNRDEMAHIAESFNIILNNLKSTMQQVLLKSGEAASMEEIMEYIEQAYDNLSAGIISINNIGEITTYNKEAEALIGIQSNKVLGLDIKNPIPIELKPIITPLSRCMAKGSLQLKTITDLYNVD